MIDVSPSTRIVLPSTPLGRFWRGFGSTAMTQVIAAANAIILVPLFLRAWGVDGYGRWLSLTALLSYLSLIDLGGQSFIGNQLAAAHVQGDTSGFRRILTNGTSLFGLISFIALGVITALLCLPGLAFPGQRAPLPLDDRFILLCLTANVLLATIGGVYASAYRATGHFARGTMLVNAMRAITLASAATILLLRQSPVFLASLYLAIGVCSFVVILLDMGRQLPVTRGVRLSMAAARAGRVFLGGSLYFWLVSVSYAINFQGVVLVLVAYATPAAVTLYVTHRTLSGLVGYVGTLLQGPLWPELTFLHTQRRTSDLARVTVLSVKLVVFLGGCAALGLWVILPVIYPVWTGKQLQIQPVVLALFLTQAVLAGGWSTAGWSLLAASQHRGLAYWALANAVLTIVLAVLLAPRWGIVGVASATLAGDLVCGLVVYPHLAGRLLKISAYRIYLAMLQPGLGVVLLGTVVVGGSLLATGWRGLLMGGAAGLILLFPVSRVVLGRQDWLWLTGAACRLIRQGA